MEINEIAHQINALTGNAYEGRNQGELRVAKQLHGYQSDAWITFLQAKQMNRKIKKGSHGVSIFKGFAQFDQNELRQNGKMKAGSVSRPLGFARVFNLDQTEEYAL